MLMPPPVRMVGRALPVKFLVHQASEQVDAVEGSLGQLGQIRRHAAAAEAEIVGRSARGGDRRPQCQGASLALVAALAEVHAPGRPPGKRVRSTTGLAECWLDTMFERAVPR